MSIPGAEAGRYLSFILGDEAYAIPVEMVEVVLETPAVTRVPNAIPHMRGVINYRGSVVPIVDPRLRFDGTPIALDDTSSVIVLQMKYEGEEVVVGMLADGVREVVEIPGASIERAPSMGSRTAEKFIAGVAKLGDGFVVLLDVEAAFSKTESVVVGDRP
jgi:purine-binding chemotaxis protein CheW